MPSPPAAGAPAELPLIHNVFFTLKDGAPAQVQRLVAACKQWLAGHPGELFFAVGPLVPGLERPVNVRDFHVGLHIVFASKRDHDVYQAHARHLRFIEEQRDSWAQVRVFDTYGTR